MISEQTADGRRDGGEERGRRKWIPVRRGGEKRGGRNLSGLLNQGKVTK